MPENEIRPNNAYSVGATLSDGRRALIRSAVYECLTILKLMQRMEYVSKSKTTLSFDDDDKNKFKQFVDRHPNKQHGFITSSQFLEYEQKYPSDILKIVELSLSQSYLKTLAIVIFCQIFHSGYEDGNYTQKNDKEKNLLEMKNIIAETVSEQNANDFVEFVDRALYLRNKMIAHADGDAFEYKIVNHAVASHRMTIAEVDEISTHDFSRYLEAIWAGYVHK